MEPFDLLRYVTNVFEDLGIRHFVTGSMATIFYGEPRFTNDIDVVADLTDASVENFYQRFPDQDFYLSLPAIRDALSKKSQFNIIHPASGLKVDVVIPASNEFNESRFARVKRIQVSSDLQVCFASPEDAIIMKMYYFRIGGSEKHLRDITGVLKASPQRLDMAYMTRWARQLALADVWSAIQERLHRDQ